MVTHYYQLPPDDGVIIKQGPEKAKLDGCGEGYALANQWIPERGYPFLERIWE